MKFILGITIALTYGLVPQYSLAQKERFKPAPPGAFDPSKPSDSKEQTSPTTAIDTEEDTTLINSPPSFAKAQPEEITNENFPDLIDSFDYPNADISDVIKAISELTGKNFIVDPGVRGKITIIAPSKITKAEAYKAFLTALSMNGFTVVPSGNFLKIKNSRSAQRDSITTYSGAYSPDTDQMITRIIHLKHVSAAEINKSLRVLHSKDGEMAVYTPTNSLIISDYGANIQRVVRILKQLDVPGFEEQLEVIPIKYAKSKDIAELIEQIINKDNKTSSRGRRGSFTAGIPRVGDGSTSSSAFSMVIPDERTNAIIVVGNKAGIKKIRGLVKKLDFRLSPEDAGGVYVYYMKYGKAKEIADILNGIAKDQKDDKKDSDREALIRRSSKFSRFEQREDSSGNLFGSDVKIAADETINSLIITASKQDFQAVKALLEKIDIPRNQVNVEAVIMEIAADKNDAKSLSYYQILGENEDGETLDVVPRVGFNSHSSNLQSLLTPGSSTGSILTFGGGKKVKVNLSGNEIEIPSLIGFINFIKGITDVNILSTPHITAMDNEKAELEVGDEIPTGITNSTASNGTTTNSIEKTKATIKLVITPVISPGSNSVVLEIEQSVKDLSNTQVKSQKLAEASQAVSERSLKTKIMVRDGDTAVLGGLIREKEEVTQSKVPLLGDIPILGWLFKSEGVSKKKTNLVMFITPKILRSSTDVKELRQQRIGERLDFIKKHMNGVDPHGAKMEDIVNRADNISNKSTNQDQDLENDDLDIEEMDDSDEGVIQ